MYVCAVDCLRIIRALRFKVDSDSGGGSTGVSYGTHLGLGMALGLLFLGQGRFSLKHSSASVACLIMATTPRYPTRTVDNTGHLQALRHLYLLAVEPRLCETVDLQTGTCVSVQVEVSRHLRQFLLCDVLSVVDCAVDRAERET